MKISIGQKVTYKAESGREYAAIVTAIPDRPWHGDFPMPTVSLETTYDL